MLQRPHSPLTLRRSRRLLRGAERLEDRRLLAANVVINELHVDPSVKTQPLEFIELFNAGDSAADLTGWQFSEGVSFHFPPGTLLPAGDYLVVAEDPAALQAADGVAALGPFSGRLSNEGEQLTLIDAAGVERDTVEFRMGFPWPIVGDDRDFSMELLHPLLDNDLGGSWRASAGAEAVNRVLASGLTGGPVGSRAGQLRTRPAATSGSIDQRSLSCARALDTNRPLPDRCWESAWYWRTC